MIPRLSHPAYPALASNYTASSSSFLFPYPQQQSIVCTPSGSAPPPKLSLALPRMSILSPPAPQNQSSPLAPKTNAKPPFPTKPSNHNASYPVSFPSSLQQYHATIQPHPLHDHYNSAFQVLHPSNLSNSPSPFDLHHPPLNPAPLSSHISSEPTRPLDQDTPPPYSIRNSTSSVNTPKSKQPSTPVGHVYFATPRGHMYAKDNSGRREVAFSPSMVGKFRLRSAHLSSPLFSYEKRFARHKDSRGAHPDVRVNPLAASVEEAADLPHGVVPQVCAELLFSARHGFSEIVEFDLGHRAIRVPLPYAICIRVTDIDDAIRPVSAKIELNLDQPSSMLVSMICAHAIFEREEDNEGRNMYQDVILTFWGSPDTYAKLCVANLLVTVTDINDESYETAVCLSATSVEPVIAVECPSTKSKVQRNDTHVTFAAGKAGEESITVWNETEGSAPLLLNVLVKDSAKGVFSVGREADDSCVCFPVTLPPASSFSFFVRFDLSYAQLKQLSYYGCVLIKLASMYPKGSRTWGDRDLHWTYDHVLALQVCPNDEDFVYDLPSEVIQTPSEDFYNIQEFLEGEGDIEDIYPLDIDVGACDPEQVSDGLEEGPLHEGVFSMLEPVQWILSKEIADTEDVEHGELDDHQENCGIDYVSPLNESEMKGPACTEAREAGDTGEGNLNWQQQLNNNQRQHSVCETVHDTQPMDSNEEHSCGNDKISGAIDNHLQAEQSTMDKDGHSGIADQSNSDRSGTVPSIDYRSEKESTKSAASKGTTCCEQLTSDGNESTPFSIRHERYPDKTPFGKLVGYGPISDQVVEESLSPKRLELNEANDFKHNEPLASAISDSMQPSREMVEADTPLRDVHVEVSSAPAKGKETSTNGCSSLETENPRDVCEANALSDSNDLSKMILRKREDDVDTLLALQSQQLAKQYVPSRRETLDSAFAQFGSITSSRESIVGENLFNSGLDQSSQPTSASQVDHVSSVVHTEDVRPGGSSENFSENIECSTSQFNPLTMDFSLHSARKNTTSGTGVVSCDSQRNCIGTVQAQRENAPKPPKIPNREQLESFAFRDHRKSLSTGREQESISSASTFTSVRNSGIVERTAQRFTLRSVFNKDKRPRLRMPRRIHQNGLCILTHRGSVVLPIFNASSVSIEVHVKVEAQAGYTAKVVTNPNFLVVQSARRSEIVITRDSACSGSLSIVLLCKSVKDERLWAAYRVPLDVEPLREVAVNSGFKIDRPSLTYYNPGGDARINRVRVYNGTANKAVYQVWIGRGKIGEASATHSPFQVKKGSMGTALSKQSVDVDVEFNAGEVVGHFYEELNIMMDNQLEKMRLFGYSGGSEIRLELTKDKLLRARNSGRRFGFIVITGPDETSDDVHAERVVLAPGKEETFEMPFGSGSLIYTGDEIARVRFCMAVNREPAVHGDNEHMLRLFLGKFQGAGKASIREGYDFNKDNRYTLYYASRLLESTMRQYTFDIDGEKVSLSKGITADLRETWRAVREEGGAVRIINNDPRETLAFTADGTEPNRGKVPPLGDSRVIPFREQISLHARGSQLNLDVG